MRGRRRPIPPAANQQRPSPAPGWRRSGCRGRDRRRRRRRASGSTAAPPTCGATSTGATTRLVSRPARRRRCRGELAQVVGVRREDRLLLRQRPVSLDDPQPDAARQQPVGGHQPVGQTGAHGCPGGRSAGSRTSGSRTRPRARPAPAGPRRIVMPTTPRDARPPSPPPQVPLTHPEVPSRRVLLARRGRVGAPCSPGGAESARLARQEGRVGASCSPGGVESARLAGTAVDRACMMRRLGVPRRKMRRPASQGCPRRADLASGGPARRRRRRTGQGSPGRARGAPRGSETAIALPDGQLGGPVRAGSPAPGTARRPRCAAAPGPERPDGLARGRRGRRGERRGDRKPVTRTPDPGQSRHRPVGQRVAGPGGCQHEASELPHPRGAAPLAHPGRRAPPGTAPRGRGSG